MAIVCLSSDGVWDFWQLSLLLNRLWWRTLWELTMIVSILPNSAEDYFSWYLYLFHTFSLFHKTPKLMIKKIMKEALLQSMHIGNRYCTAVFSVLHISCPSPCKQTAHMCVTLYKCLQDWGLKRHNGLKGFWGVTFTTFKKTDWFPCLSDGRK